MTLPARKFLPVKLDFTEDHDNSVFKHEFRSKVAAEEYFNNPATFGAGTLTFLGDEGTHYEFDADNGFRVLQDGGYAKILLNNIIDASLLNWFYQGGLTFELEGLTSQWVGGHDAVSGTYENPIPDVPVAPIGDTAYHAGYWWHFYHSNVFKGAYCRAINDGTTQHNRTHNGCRLYPFNNAANQTSVQLQQSYYKKGTHLKFKFSTSPGLAQAWVDNVSGIASSGEDSTVSWGNRTTWASSVYGLTPHTSGDMFLILGATRTADTGSGLWMRNLRLFNTMVTRHRNPNLRLIMSFGDSYTNEQFGSTGTATDSVFNQGRVQNYLGVDNTDFADISASSSFMKKIEEAGLGLGSMCGGGQGGKNFTTTLLNDGGIDYLDLAVRSYPSMVFTHGMHNDVSQIASAAITIADLETKLIDDYIKPVMDTGAIGWGFVIPGISKDLEDAGQTSSFTAIANMLLGLPAAWDAAYPALAGKVKVRDARPQFNQTDDVYRATKVWKNYFYGAAEVTHPSQYGGYVFGDLCADMAMEWV